MSLNKKPFDPKTLIVVAVVGLVFFGWQKYLETKYPEYYNKKQGITSVSSDLSLDFKASPAAKSSLNPSQKESESGVEDQGSAKMLPKIKTGSLLEKGRIFSVKTRLWSAQVSSLGMGLVNAENLTYRDHSGNPIFFSKEQPLLQVVNLGEQQEPIAFEVTRPKPFVLVGKAYTSDGTEILRTMEFSEELGSINIKTEIKDKKEGFKGFGVFSVEELKEHKKQTFFMPSLEYQEVVTRVQGSVEHFRFGEVSIKELNPIDLMAISTQYFTVGYLEKSSLLPQAHITFTAHNTGVLLKYLIPMTTTDDLQFESVVFLGPKSSDLLSSVDSSLIEVINFGFFSSIANLLLILLKFLNQFVHNWGIAIVLLTLVVRLIVLPINLMSYKSMKRMQLIQPKLQKIRELYPNDPQAVNRETMSLMKTEKVNPLGGCLPMFLQMPVFFALYQVLGQSVELYQVPFIFWIQDLSLKDPYYVLPILMGITLFIQQKITPTTMDPKQAKILAWMPIIFTAFTLGLPSGLTLYIFISTLFGVVQQQVFMMDKKQEITQ
jgi:YidC/Oxa1 family membrane protein insertase